ncbi:MAG: IS30 family transposase [Bacteroidales bacterium]|nr:IS30 family transposase [Bacteroidales bacterium]
MDKKNYNHITEEQRIKIETLLKAGHKVSFIAKQLSIHRPSIYRELKRNQTKTGKYNATFAQELSEEQKERFSYNRSFTFSMEKFIIEKLSKEQWSPEQILGYCKENNIDMVSHESIYKFVYQDKAEGGMLYKNLRVASKKYRKRYGSGKGKRCIIKDKVSIDERPEWINNKQRIGDWEIDTIVGKDNKGAIVTIAERVTAFVLIAKLNGKNAQELAEAVVKLMMPFKDLVLSITSDNGTEFTMHKYISKKLGALFYFAHPYSSWERGLNEYTNRLIRQYIPKKTDFKDVNRLYINEITMKLNRRPRKKLNYNTPGKVFLNKFDNNVALAS